MHETLAERLARAPLLVVDVETGGLDPKVNALLEIAAKHLPTGKVFHVYIIPEGECHPGAIAINGLTGERLASLGAIPESRAMGEFAEWLMSLGAYLWTGANPKFDWGFVDAALRRCGIECKLDYHTYDIQSVAVLHHMQGKITLPMRHGVPSPKVDSLVAAYGIEQLRMDDIHGGLVDVQMEVEVALRQLEV
jgi:DNA polymerase III subunit epsilon